MIKFEKVSYEQFKKDCLAQKVIEELNEENEKWLKVTYDNIRIPTRGSKGSAGYDFYAPFNFKITSKGEPRVIPSGIKVSMEEDMFLALVPRSSLGFKFGVYLCNSYGVIDYDYYNNINNEGHIMFKMQTSIKDCELMIGERFAQGIFMKYYKVDDDNTNEERSGGFGSTGK